MKGEPFDAHEARLLVRNILVSGNVSFTRHAREEMAKDGLTRLDVEHVLRAGLAEFPELKKGTWRYRIAARQVTVVIAFRAERDLVVVTAWRSKR